MITFVVGLLILAVGGMVYGKFCEHIFCPDDRKTPAIARNDGVDYVPMKRWRNSLINLLNIAGTGPILGPIQGILFGPIAFITIPVGCVLGGAMHDYFAGMICEREGGKQMPELIKKYTNGKIAMVYTVFISLLMILVGVVFIYTPGDILSTQLLGGGGTASEASMWIIYSVIMIYYIVATILPIDKIIGKVYPLFGGILILSAAGIFIMLFARGYPLAELWRPWTLNGFDFGEYFRNNHFIPTFFITVACGILSGFHATQTSLISRTIRKEKEGRTIFFNMMLAEGFIAMVWAAAAMAMIGLGADHSGITMQFADGSWQYYQNVNGALQAISATSVVGVICRNILGHAGGIIAIIGVVVLPITTGDTALRSLRLIIAELFHMDQDTNTKRLKIAMPLFVTVFIILIFAKLSPAGFNILWRYMGWANQSVSLFTFTVIVIWMIRSGMGKYIWVPAIPMIFYAFVTSSYILNAPIGFHLPWAAAYSGGVIFAAAVLAFSIWKGKRG